MDYKYTTPVPMPRGTHYGSNYWLMQSMKCHQIVAAYSNLEYENLLTLEMDHRVEYFCPQPLKTPVVLDGKTSETVFDVYAVYTDGTEEMQEVKYSSELNGDDRKAERTKEQIEKQKAWCHQNDIKYIVRTEKEIEQGRYFIRNLAVLAAKNRRFLNTDVSEKMILSCIREMGNPTIGMIKQSGIISPLHGTDLLASMYYKGLIILSDIEEKPISNLTEVSCNGN